MSRLRNLIGCACVLALFATQARADVVTPSNVTATSEFGFGNPAINLINGSGLNGVGPVEDQLHNNTSANNWIVDVFAVPPTSDVDLEFTLDGTYDLSGAYIWNLNNIAGDPPSINDNFRGVKEFDLLVSPNLTDPFVSAGNFTLNQANVTSTSTSDPEPAQAISFAASSVRRVKFELISNFAGDASPPIVDNVVGLSEVRFEGVRVPEPTAFALGTLGILALANRRRRRR